MNRRRGAALFFVLLITAVVAALMAAFVALNRQQFALTADTGSRQMAYQACLSGMSYVQSLVENNANFGKSGFAPGTFTYQSVMNVTVHGDGTPNPVTNWIDGEVHPPGGLELAFTVRLFNNLESTDSVVGSNTNLGATPARSIRLRVEGRAGRTTRRLDAILRRQAFTNSSTQTEKDLNVEADTLGWSVESKDPINQIRANGNIHLPDPVTGGGLFKFLGIRGTAKAGGSIFIPQGDLQLASNAALKATVERADKANGRMQVQAPPVPVPDLNKDQLKMPTDSLELDAGGYTVGQANKTVWQPINVEVDPDQDPNNNNNITVPKFQRATQSYSTFRGPDNRTIAYRDPNGGVATSAVYPPDIQDNAGQEGWDVRPDDYDEDGMVVLGTVKVDDDQDSSTPKVDKNACFDIPGRVLSLPPGARIDVNGDFNLGTNTFDGASSGNITLLMGFDMEVTRATPTSTWQRNSDFAATGLTKYAALGVMGTKGAALVTAGNVHVTGSCYGLGSISADKSIHFSAPTGLTSTPNVGLAVRGGEKIEMMPPPAVRDTSLLMVDGPIFNKAIEATDPTYATLSGAITDSVADSLRAKEVQKPDGSLMGVADAWAAMASELGRPGSPDWTKAPYNSVMADGKFTIQEYIQLRELCRSGEEKWLTDIDYVKSAKNMVPGQVTTYQMWAMQKEGDTLPDFVKFMRRGAQVPQMYFRGLVYAGKDGIDVIANRNAFYNEGAMVSKGNIRILDSPGVSSVYNRAFLDDIVKPFGNAQVRLETIFFNLQ